MLKLWRMPANDQVQSQFASNFSSDISLEQVCERTGLKYYHFNPENLDNNESFNELKVSNGYNYEDRVAISPIKLGSNYEAKLKIFYTEHLHTDDEIRLVLDGSGYFDVRDENDDWIRLWTRKGDLIVLPAGIYHRFTTDENHHIEALRLFCGEPIWTPFNRPCDDLPSRLDYIKKVLKKL